MCFKRVTLGSGKLPKMTSLLCFWGHYYQNRSSQICLLTSILKMTKYVVNCSGSEKGLTALRVTVWDENKE